MLKAYKQAVLPFSVYQRTLHIDWWLILSYKLNKRRKTNALVEAKKYCRREVSVTSPSL